jgi:hypothetical protein
MRERELIVEEFANAQTGFQVERTKLEVQLDIRDLLNRRIEPKESMQGHDLVERIWSFLELAEGILKGTLTYPPSYPATIIGDVDMEEAHLPFMQEERYIRARPEIIERLHMIKNTITQGEFDALIENVDAVINLVKGE